VLLATSNFTFSGNATFNGIVLVIGTGVFTANGTNCFNGGVFLAKTTGGVLGTPTMGVSGGGNCGFTYNSSDINLASNLFSYKALAVREIDQ
jgi:hypothetical protein